MDKLEKPIACSYGCIVIRAGKQKPTREGMGCTCLRGLTFERQPKIVKAFRWYWSEIACLKTENKHLKDELEKLKENKND